VSEECGYSAIRSKQEGGAVWFATWSTPARGLAHGLLLPLQNPTKHTGRCWRRNAPSIAGLAVAGPPWFPFCDVVGPVAAGAHSDSLVASRSPQVPSNRFPRFYITLNDGTPVSILDTYRGSPRSVVGCCHATYQFEESFESNRGTPGNCIHILGLNSDEAASPLDEHEEGARPYPPPYICYAGATAQRTIVDDLTVSSQSGGSEP